MSKFAKILTLNCREATALLSQRLDEPLSLLERVALRAHLCLCVPCGRCARQLALIRDTQQAPTEHSPSVETEGESLSEEAKARLEQALRRAMGE